MLFATIDSFGEFCLVAFVVIACLGGLLKKMASSSSGSKIKDAAASAAVKRIGRWFGK